MGDRSSARCGAPRPTATLGGAGPNRVMCQDHEVCDVKSAAYAGHGVEIEEDVIRLCRRRPDRTVLLLVALYACRGLAIPAMKLMVDTVPPVGGAALVFLLAGVVLAGAARGRPLLRRSPHHRRQRRAPAPHLQAVGRDPRHPRGRLGRRMTATGWSGWTNTPAKTRQETGHQVRSARSLAWPVSRSEG